MVMKRTGLGRGLAALIPGNEDPSATGVQEVDVSSIVPNPYQPRQTMAEESLQELAASIKEHGVLQPLNVTPIDAATAEHASGARYQLIAGERRLTAARLAGLKTVPVIIRRNVSPQQALELAMIENLQRADLNPMEEAAGFERLMSEFRLTQEQAAERVGKSRAVVANKVRLLTLPDQVKEALRRGDISEGHARALLGLDSPELQIAGLKEVVKRGMSVRAAEEWVRRVNAAAQITREGEDAEPPRDPHLAALEDDFRRALGTKVDLHRSSRGGRVVIHFYSDEELQGIYSAIVRV